MLDKRQFLLTKLAEECTEVGQRALKQIQFGRDETQEGQLLSNGERLKNELLDLYSIVWILEDTNEVAPITPSDMVGAVNRKREKLQKYADLSASLGQMERFTL